MAQEEGDRLGGRCLGREDQISLILAVGIVDDDDRRALLPLSRVELRGLLEQAGFVVASIDLLPNVIVHRSADAAIDFSQASSFGNFLGHRPEELRRAARDDIRIELDALKTAEGIRQEGARIVAVARKAAR